MTHDEAWGAALIAAALLLFIVLATIDGLAQRRRGR